MHFNWLIIAIIKLSNAINSDSLKNSNSGFLFHCQSSKLMLIVYFIIVKNRNISRQNNTVRCLIQIHFRNCLNIRSILFSKSPAFFLNQYWLLSIKKNFGLFTSCFSKKEYYCKIIFSPHF